MSDRWNVSIVKLQDPCGIVPSHRTHETAMEHHRPSAQCTRLKTPVFGLVLTGAIAGFAALGAFSPGAQAAIDPNVCYAASDATDQLVTIEKDGSNPTIVGAFGRIRVEALTLSLDEETLYAGNENSSGTQGEFGSVNENTGLFTLVGNLGTGSGSLGNINFIDPDGLTVDARTDIIYASIRREATTTPARPADSGRSDHWGAHPECLRRGSRLCAYPKRYGRRPVRRRRHRHRPG